MEEKFKNFLILSSGFSFLIASISLAWFFKSYINNFGSQRTFSVSGEGKVIAIPDVATINFEVKTEGGKDLKKLTQENNQKAESIISYLKNKGIEEKDIKTTSYRILPRYQYYSCYPTNEEKPCPPPEIVGYTISQGYSLKIRKLEEAGEILDAIVKKGANVVSGISFQVDNPEKYKEKAREEAILKAKEKALKIARSSGFTLGKIVSIEEVSSPEPIFPYFTRAEAGKTQSPTPSIEPGSQEIKVDVRITYEIK